MNLIITSKSLDSFTPEKRKETRTLYLMARSDEEKLVQLVGVDEGVDGLEGGGHHLAQPPAAVLLDGAHVLEVLLERGHVLPQNNE